MMMIGKFVWHIDGLCPTICGLSLLFFELFKEFFPLDEAVVSRAVFVIVSGLDGRIRFWSQLNN